MAIINQNLDFSEKKILVERSLGAVATGVTSLIAVMPSNCILQGFNLSGFGLSGLPTYSLSVFRATAGGLTSIPLGVSLVAQAFGTSGPVGASIAAPGISLMAGDAIVMLSGTADTAIASGIASVVYSCLADFKSYQNTVS